VNMTRGTRGSQQQKRKRGSLMIRVEMMLTATRRYKATYSMRGVITIAQLCQECLRYADCARTPCSAVHAQSAYRRHSWQSCAMVITPLIEYVALYLLVAVNIISTRIIRLPLFRFCCWLPLVPLVIFTGYLSPFL
jgi:hypothetical protein